MTDLRHHLEEIAGPVPATTAGTAEVDGDIIRGQRAMRRRRTARAAAGSVFGVAALVAALTVGATVFDAGPRGSTTVAAGVQLVAYRGEQPRGFTIDKVPDGWFIQTDDTSSLLLAPEKSANTDPQSFVGKIAIMLESRDQHGPSRDGIPVRVGDRDGTLLKSLPGQTPDGPAPTRADGDTGWELWVPQPSGVYLIVQYWEGLGLSRDQMVELGAGVHVHEGAQQGVG